MKRLLLLLAAVLLAGIATAVLLRPETFLAPGPLTAPHRALSQRCLACHSLSSVAISARCVDCHSSEKIGAASPTGTPAGSATRIVKFHQQLSNPDCTSCHREHRGLAALVSSQPFSHEWLNAGVRDRCESCHAAPANAAHELNDLACTTCHQTGTWKGATFDHDRFFPLKGPHQADCKLCHDQATATTYSCYGCHQHNARLMGDRHAAKGVQATDDCVACHLHAVPDRPEEKDDRDD